ncbi:hypothetical protein OESDEN_07548, partial [Oesophagostomum dentatum]
LLGIGTLFLYLGYFTQCFISESVIHSVHSKDPERISGFAGYYGQAFHYSAFAISSLFSAGLQHYFSSKWILFISTVLFAVYHLGFFHINSYYFYFSQVMMGFAYSLYNNGEGAYIAEHSSRRTVESNSGIETAAIYGMFFGVTLLAMLTFAFLPTKQYDSIASNSPRIIPSFKTQIKELAKTFVHPNMLLLFFTFLYMGILVSFFLGIYPTTLSFTASLVQDTYIVAFYSGAVGLAELSGGVFVRPMIKKLNKKRKLLVVMLVHVVVVISGTILFLLSVPERSTIEPNDGSSLLLKPNRYIACAIGYLIGMGDFTLTMARVIICQVAVPQNRNEVFSLTRIYQCISSCVVLFLSTYMTVTCWSTVLLTGMVIGVTTFLIVARNTSSETNKVSPVKNFFISKLNRKETSKEELAKTFVHPNMLLLFFTFLYMGILVSFFLGIYPTTLSFTASLVQDTYIVAFYSGAVGLAELSGGVFVRPMIKKLNKKRKLLVVMLVHVVVVISGTILFLLSVPERSTIEPNDGISLLLKPNRYIACAIGYLIGMGDFTLTMARVIICQVAVPQNRNEVFSLTRIYQCISSCVVLFLSTYMTVTCWSTVLLTGMVIGVTTFLIVARNTSSETNKVS